MSECSICQENITNIYKTNCNHEFHKECLEEWIQTCKNNGNLVSCPICRQEIHMYSYHIKEKIILGSQIIETLYETFNIEQRTGIKLLGFTEQFSENINDVIDERTQKINSFSRLFTQIMKSIININR